MKKLRLSETKRQIIHFVDKVDDALIEQFSEKYHGHLKVGVPPIAHVIFTTTDSATFIKRDGENLYLSPKLRDLELFTIVYKVYWTDYLKKHFDSKDLILSGDSTVTKTFDL
jgi:hypothetical protein